MVQAQMSKLTYSLLLSRADKTMARGRYYIFAILRDKRRFAEHHCGAKINIETKWQAISAPDFPGRRNAVGGDVVF